MEAYSFGTFLLMDPPRFVVTGITPPQPALESSRLALAHREGSAVARTRWTEVTATVRGTIVDHVNGAEEWLDLMTRNLRVGVQDLKMGFDAERYWRARLSGLSVEKVTPAFYRYTASFLLVDPFAYTTPESITNSNALTDEGSTASKTVSVFVGGGVRMRPVYTLTLTSAPAAVSAIEVQNTSTAESIRVPWDYVAGNVLVIDTNTYSVTVDGAEVEWSGALPLLDRAAGANNDFLIRATATSPPGITFEAAWNLRWLV